MRVLYLFSNPKQPELIQVEQGRKHDNHFYGMLRLRNLGISSDFAEVEQVYPGWLAAQLRRTLSIYSVHLPVLWKLFSPDIVFTPAAYGAQLLHALWPFKKSKWVMYDFSIAGLLGERKGISQKILSWMVKRSAGIVTISKQEAGRLLEMFPALTGKVAFVPFGVDLSFFKPREVPEENFIFVPGFAPERDYETLFEACKDLGVRVIVSQARSIEERKDVPDFVEVLKIESTTYDEILDMYARAKVIVLPLNIKDGRNEASGCSTLVEAMAMGKAIVATRTPTLESYVEDGVSGIFVVSKNSSALKTALEKFLGDPLLRISFGKNARRFVEEYCDAHKTAKLLQIFLKSL